ncbi:hypothetical protein PMI17_02984 [Pantoea sp. GM01]|nr:hypothetical protein PMI17_02984 [Pantoea sp. GM01]
MLVRRNTVLQQELILYHSCEFSVLHENNWRNYHGRFGKNRTS